MDTEIQSLHVLMFPWLAHGHISPFLELAKKLCQYNFTISFVSTPINISSIKKHVCAKTFPSIQLVELHLPSITDLPPHYHTTKSLPPYLMSTLKEAFDMAQPSFSNLLTSLKPDLLIYDYIQPWAPELASRNNIPGINFLTMGAAAACYFYYMCKTPVVKFPFQAIYYEEYEYNNMAQILQSYSTSMSGSDRYIHSIDRSSGIVLIKTHKEMEATYSEHFSSILGGKEVLPVGSLVQEETMTTDYIEKQFGYLMSWLDKKDKCSVVFVSFGSEYFMPKEEIQEIAYGLELSGVRFIWVIRFHEGEESKEVQEVLPEGFLDRVRERGMVVEGWAPQVKILAHGSVGGFVSHCGWSSTLEALKYGVPLIAMPMHLDQPLNARLVVEIGVGVEVKKSGEGKIDRREMAKVIKEVMVEKNRGDEFKRRMNDISEKIRGGGEMDLVVDKLIKLCERKKFPKVDESSSLQSKQKE